MSKHRIAWTHDGDTIRGVFTCHEPEDAFAPCRTVCAQDCETWSDVAEDGRTHITDDGAVHEMRQTDYCNVLLFLEDGAEELYDGPDEPVHDGPIKESWDGDGYVWSYVGETSEVSA